MAVIIETSPRMQSLSEEKKEETNLKALLTGVVLTLLFVGVIALAAFIYLGAMGRDASLSEDSDDFEYAGGADDGRYGGGRGGGVGSGGWVVLPKGDGYRPTGPQGSTTLASSGGQPKWTTTTLKPDGRHLAAEFINASLNWNFAPCDDFYKFVCSRFAGNKTVLGYMHDYTQQAVREMLSSIHIPSRRQKPTEKAAALFRACTRLGSSTPYSEVHYLKCFLGRMGLDFSNMTYDPDFNILARIGRLSFELGMPAFAKFSLHKSPPDIPDYILKVEINSEDQDWLEAKHEKFSSADLTSHYTEYLRDYDSSIVVTKISESIISSERAMRDLISSLRKDKSGMTMTTVEKLGSFTESHVSNGQWVWLVSRFTSKNFTATDTVLVLDSAPSVVGLLMDRGRLARHDARVLLAWTLVHRLLPFAHSKWFLKNSAEYTSVEAFTSSVCYRTVSSVMSMAVYHRYFSNFVPPKVVESAESMVRSLMDTLEVKVSRTSWIKEPVRSVLLTKAREMALLMAYPDEYRNETAVVDFYARFPDVGAEFFTPYVASLRLLTMRIFRGHVNAVFKPAHVNALFNFEENIIKVYAGILQPPVFFYGAPAAINYGGLGQVAGHEMMHAYDVQGIALDRKNRPIDFKQTFTMRQYEKKLLCLRDSYMRAEPSSRARSLSDRTDSEGFADYAGLLLAHAAFQKLPAEEREAVLPGIGLTAEHLFYVAHCAKWCVSPSWRRHRHPLGRYWPARSRCIVPLQNMPEFTAAYQCKPGDLMKPETRCRFW
ncbi:neprilysin-1-like [Amblyomma americanum]